MVAVMKTLVEGVLHMVLAPLFNIAARGVPEPLEGVLNTANNPLSPKVVGHVRLHWLEDFDLVIIQILQSLLCGHDG